MFEGNVIVDFDKQFKKYEEEINKKDEENRILFEEIKNNIYLIDNENFFKTEKDTAVKIIDTGIGKTYNSAYLALYKLFYTADEKIIFTTTKNENVFDFIKELHKILTIEIKNKTEKIIKFLDNFDYEKIKICQLTSFSKFNKDKIINSRIIITNHSYFYSNNHSTFNLKSTELLIHSINKNKTILLIDEFDELEKQSFIEIPLNSFYKQVKTIDKEWIEKESKNAFTSYNLKFYKDNKDSLRYTLPRNEENTIYEYIGDFQTPTYRITNKEGTQYLLNTIDDNCIIADTIEEFGRREGFYIYNQKEKNAKKWNLVRVEIIKRLTIKENCIFTDNELLKLIDINHGACIVEQQIWLTNKTRDNENNVDHEILRKFESNEEFINFCRNEIKSDALYDSLIKKLIKEGKNLYKKRLIIRRKSILNRLNCKIYKYTATPNILSNLGYNLEYCKMKAPSSLEKIDIFFIDQKIGIDKKIIAASIDKFQGKDVNVLSFVSLRTAIDNLLKSEKKSNDKYKNITCISSINDGQIDIKPHAFTLYQSTEYENTRKNVKLAYLNGTESTGKNYSDTDICFINGVHDINIASRLIITEFSTNYLDIEKASLKTIIQAGGRIERTGEKQQKYKALIIIGDSTKTINKYVESKAGNGIEYNIIKINSIDKIIKNIEDKIKKYNQGIDTDIRMDKKEKFNHDEIIKFYLDLVSDDQTEKEAKKITMDKFDIKKCYLNTLIREYKNRI